MANPRIDVVIGAKISEFQKAIADSESSLNKFGRSATKIGKGLSLAITAPILAIGTVAVKTASDFEETSSKFETVFRDISKSADEAFKDLRNNFGLSSRASKELLGNTGDLLTGFGFSQKAALDLSLEVNKLAVDLASFTNFSGGAKGASDALTKALLGERESIKSLGISILEEDVKKQVGINTAKGLTFETERQAKAYATLDLAIQQSGNAIGDRARTEGSLANQTRLLQNRIEDLALSFGEILLPVATKIVVGINNIVKGFLSLDESTRKSIIVISGLAAAIGPLSLAIGAAISALPILSAGFLALISPIGVITSAILGLGIGLVTSFDEIVFKVKITALEFVNASVTIVKALDVLASAIPGFSSTTTGAVLALQSFGKEISDSIINDLGKDGKSALDRLKDAWNQLTTSVDGTKKAVEDLDKTFGGADFIDVYANRLLALNKALNETPVNKLNQVASRLTGNEFDDVGVDLGDEPPVPDIPEELVESIKEKTTAIADAFSSLGVQIASSLNISNDALRGFITTLLSNAPKIIQAIFKQAAAKKAAAEIENQANLQVASGNVIVSATEAAKGLGPVGLAILPVLIGGALALISSAFGKGGGGSSGGGVGSGVSGTSFQGQGATAFNGNREIFGELVVRGNDLVYVFDQSRDKIAKG